MGVEFNAAVRTDLTPTIAASFDTLYSSDYRRVVALVAGLCGSVAVAEEIAQDAFLAAHRRWTTISRFEDPGAWVRNVAMNRARDLWRRRAAERRALARLDLSKPPPLELAPRNAEFWAAVQRLPRQQAKAIALFYIEDRSVAEIARVLGCSEGSVKTHLARARHQLAKALLEDR